MIPAEDTIVAIATPIGTGALSVIRVSGKGAIAIVDSRFIGRQPLGTAASHTAHFGRFTDERKEAIDEVVATVFRAPHSYTAEDIVEISCHGGALITRRILESLLLAGARSALPGEFTRRAFLNGRIDLSQAEAVADMIQAKSELARKASFQQLSGRFSQHIGNIRDKLLKICSLLELELDFAEEGLEFTDRGKISSEIVDLIALIDDLVQSYEVGKLWRDGVSVVIAGQPNVGKSSILNALLKEARAIVTPHPGTTRDTIEENIVIDGILFRLIDTAGLRSTNDVVEIEGIQRTHSEIGRGDLIMFVLDGSRKIDEIDEKMISELEERHSDYLLVVNKIDIAGREVASPVANATRISATTGEGLEDLRQRLVRKTLNGQSNSPEASIVVTNARHKESLLKGKECLLSALKSLQEGSSNEFIAIDIREAMSTLGEIIGVVTTDDLLDSIFSKFCIGK